MEKKLTKAERKDKRNKQLCLLVKENDLYAENQLLMENEGLIRQLASHMEINYELDDTHHGGIDMDDIMQEGRIAMLRAAQKFNPDVDIKFSTYAYQVMKNAMTDLCKKGMSTFEKHLEDKGLTRIFLDAEPENGEGALYGNGTSVEYHDPTGNLAVLHVMLEKMRNRLEWLSTRQRRLLAYRYGLSAMQEHSISESASFFHLSEKFLKLMEKDALETLRAGMNDGKIV